tara:strand:- start:1158 stop:3149 length:1992 start_codon:yes stop_codon:yes gene_type:complete
MSYIVAPSSQKEYELVDSSSQGNTIQQPSSYINHFSNPIKIKKNSEIALLSAKINRTDTFNIQDNTGYYVYLGNELSLTSKLNTESTTPIPYNLTRALSDTEVVSGGKTAQTPVELLQSLDINMKNIYHPEFKNKGSATFEIDTSGAPKTRSFGGYKLILDQANNGSATTDVNASFNPADQETTFEDIESASKSASVTISASGATTFPTITRISDSEDDLECIVMGTDHPLALSEGSAVFHIGDNNASQGGFQVAMTRPKQLFNQTPGVLKTLTSPLREYPPYYTNNGNIFYDWGVRVPEESNVNDRHIEVFQTTVKDGVFTQTEIEYWTANAANTAFSGNITYENWDPANYSDIKFTAIGERMLIELYNTKSSTWVKLIDASDGTEPLTKSTKSINQNCFYMYPLIDISKKNASVGLSEYNGRKTYTETKSFGKSALEYTKSGFYSSCMRGKFLGNYGLEAIEQLDFRETNRSTTTRRNASLIGLNASGGVAYSTVMILEHAPNRNSTRYMNQSENAFAKAFGAHSSDYLGFTPMNEISRSTYANDKNASGSSRFHFSSTSAPTPYSRSNSFIRINDLPIESYNGANSGISKIIGTIPRFDNTNAEVGALNFDIANPVYLDLNNTEAMQLNQLKIDFVNIDETIVTDLTGTTIVTLHIREKK